MRNAFVSTWNEEDIIGSCVANALAQGCDRAFLLDNASTDRTVQQAVRAGAVYHATYETDEFDEAQKTVKGGWIGLSNCESSTGRRTPSTTSV